MLDWDIIFFQDDIKKIEKIRKEIELNTNKGNFIDAINKIDKIDVEIERINQKLEKNFIEFFESAKTNYENLSYLSADQSIKNALRLKPNDLEAKQLKSKIEILPKKIKILTNIETARIENNKKKELEYLQDLRALQEDPELDIQIKNLNNSIVRLDYQEKISNMEKFLKENNIYQAENLLAQARKILPNEPEISILQEKLNKIKDDNKKKKIIFKF